MDTSLFPIPDAPHALSEEQIFSALHTTKEGLSSKEAAARLKAFGKNQLEEERVRPWAIFLRQFKNILIYTLLAASFLSIAIGETIDSFVILAIVIINTLIGFWQELKAEGSIQELKKLTESKAKVFRDGKAIDILSSEIVPGDLIFIREGEIVTADIRLIECSSLLVDESSLTGESMPVSKEFDQVLEKETSPYDLQNMLLTGTTVVRGKGKGIAVKTGTFSYFASIAEKAKEAAPETPLMKAMRAFTRRYVLAIGVIFALLFIIGFFQGRNLADLAYILIAGIVSVVPEGLPLVVTLVVVMGAISLHKKKTLVRVLGSVETLGSATVIASDKTGTITEGKLIVKESVGKDLKKLQTIAALCNDAYHQGADPIDLALSRWVSESEAIHKKYPRHWSYPFDSKLMLMATVHEIDGKKTLLVKGAYEALKTRAVHDEEIEKAFHALLEKGLRVLAFGEAPWDGNEDPHSWKIEIRGLVGFLDPAKEGVKEAVGLAKAAHIRVIMLTGDHPMTARAIAQDVGIWKEGDLILSGAEIEKMEEFKLCKEIKKATVMARILPEHKYRIVKALQKDGEIVAVSGDGVNDVPALKAADLGIAMGSGSEAAKSVSEMVITDNNLKVIIDAIQLGRVISDNIRKVIYYLISTSLQLICLISLAILAGLPLPLNAVQILWVNIVGDGVQDKVFPFAKEERHVMKRHPRKPSQKFFDKEQLWRILIFAFGVGVFLFALYQKLLLSYDMTKTSSIMFMSVVAAQWANGIQAQKESEPFFKNIAKSFSINPYIFGSLVLGGALQLSVFYWAPNWFKVTPLEGIEWVYPIGIFGLSFLVVEFRKWAEIAIHRFL